MRSRIRKYALLDSEEREAASIVLVFMIATSAFDCVYFEMSITSSLGQVD
jgi:hypothetical protein